MIYLILSAKFWRDFKQCDIFIISNVSTYYWLFYILLEYPCIISKIVLSKHIFINPLPFIELLRIFLRYQFFIAGFLHLCIKMHAHGSNDDHVVLFLLPFSNYPTFFFEIEKSRSLLWRIENESISRFLFLRFRLAT